MKVAASYGMCFVTWVIVLLHVGGCGADLPKGRPLFLRAEQPMIQPTNFLKNIPDSGQAVAVPTRVRVPGNRNLAVVDVGIRTPERNQQSGVGERDLVSLLQSNLLWRYGGVGMHVDLVQSGVRLPLRQSFIDGMRPIEYQDLALEASLPMPKCTGAGNRARFYVISFALRMQEGVYLVPGKPLTIRLHPHLIPAGVELVDRDIELIVEEY